MSEFSHLLQAVIGFRFSTLDLPAQGEAHQAVGGGPGVQDITHFEDLGKAALRLLEIEHLKRRVSLHVRPPCYSKDKIIRPGEIHQTLRSPG